MHHINRGHTTDFEFTPQNDQTENHRIHTTKDGVEIEKIAYNQTKVLCNKGFDQGINRCISLTQRKLHSTTSECELRCHLAL